MELFIITAGFVATVVFIYAFFEEFKREEDRVGYIEGSIVYRA
ncbi:MAG: hypothetical protein U9Q40_04925 [Campylobacterota bacterium]|nr:hypothetical protein [Campylobacterota bacterium]